MSKERELRKINLKVKLAGCVHRVQRDAFSTADAIQSVISEFQERVSMPIMVAGGPAN